ncbi:MAG: hypothetical protein PHI59_07675 [Candidatus Omnitrophica bacterium]|jgi:hypothetical protein|nr:hypothetical protein [Candidatus Omnitrophota bacterium]
MNIHPFTIAGVLMVALGTIFTLLGQQMLSDKSNKQLLDKSEKIEKLSEENKLLTKEISQLNKKIAADLTGGDCYCYFFISRPGKNSNIIDLMLMNDGDCPIYDISVKIDDVEKLLEISSSEMAAGKLPYDSMTLLNSAHGKASIFMQLGNLGPHQCIQLNGIQIPPNVNKKSYNIYITARNGSITQIVRYRRVNDEWKIASKIIKGGEVIKEDIDPGFPHNDKGKIDW